MEHRPQNDLTGRRFGQVVVVGYDRFDGVKHRWNVACDCGGTSSVRGGNLVSGLTKSCGCRKSKASRMNLTTHGMSGTRTHRIWKAMKQRCRDPNASNFKHYGGRGIRIADQWLDFVRFHEDMGECPPDHSIDRIDVNGHYEPGNCRWVRQAEQVKNTRRNIMVEHNGASVCLKDFAKAVGLSYGAICHEMRERNADVHTAISRVRDRHLRRCSGGEG